MAKFAISDQEDRVIWQTIHEDWARLFNSETDHRNGRASEAYRELLRSFGDTDAWCSETRGSSTSQLSGAQAFERGYGR